MSAVPPRAEAADWRRRLGVWVESAGPRNFITALIVITAVVLGLQTSESVSEAIGPTLIAINTAVISIFVLEIALKMVAFGPRFFRSGWNVFDFLVVGISLVPGSGPLQILRSLRVLRVLRLLSQVERLRVVVESLLRALPGIGWTMLLLALVFYVFGVIGTELFGERYPEFFGTLGASLYSLFQIMTLESWSSQIARPMLEQDPWAWLYFVPFILLASFMVLNLFIAIIVSATQSFHADEEQDERVQMMAELREIRTRLEELAAEGRPSGPGATRPRDGY